MAWNMLGEITGEEGNSDNLTESSPPRSDAKSGRERYGKNPRVGAFVDKYITVKNITIVAVILIIVLISVIISLAVRNPETHSPASRSVACPDFWIGYRGKCFYMSKDERNWSLSLTTCSSFNASLAVIDSQEELEFWRFFFQHIHYWFGLSKEDNIWKWSNGTNFKNQFSMRAEGFCAYVDEKGASSTICAVEKHFFCSRPESCRKSR